MRSLKDQKMFMWKCSLRKIRFQGDITKVAREEAPECLSYHRSTEYTVHGTIPSERNPETSPVSVIHWVTAKNTQEGKGETHSRHKTHPRHTVIQLEENPQLQLHPKLGKGWATRLSHHFQGCHRRDWSSCHLALQMLMRLECKSPQNYGTQNSC